ncbi:hypothetical protein ACLQ2T_27510, partial [Micromonospora sp. DT229]
MAGVSLLVGGVRPVVVAVPADGSDPLPGGRLQRIGTAGPAGPAGVVVAEPARCPGGIAVVRRRIGSPGRPPSNGTRSGCPPADPLPAPPRGGAVRPARVAVGPASAVGGTVTDAGEVLCGGGRARSGRGGAVTDAGEVLCGGGRARSGRGGAVTDA